MSYKTNLKLLICKTCSSNPYFEDLSIYRPLVGINYVEVAIMLMERIKEIILSCYRSTINITESAMLTLNTVNVLINCSQKFLLKLQNRFASLKKCNNMNIFCN